MSLNASACCFLSFLVTSADSIDDASTGGASSVSAGNTLLSLIPGSGLLSAVLGYFLSSITSGGPLFAISGCFLFPVASGGLLSTVFGYLLSLVTSNNPLSAVFNDGFLSFVPSTGF